MSHACLKLHEWLAKLPRTRYPFDLNAIPRNGIYILFEDGERAHGVDRIVRVGTHTGENKLCSRLEEHFVKQNKDRSIFRKNIGRALLRRANDPFVRQWEIDLTSHEAKLAYRSRVDPVKLHAIEDQVSVYIQSHISVVALSVETKDDRLLWEKRIIGTVSHCKECRPSTTWLGLHSPKLRIRKSGLWLVNELNEAPMSEADIENLKRIVARS